MTLYAAAEAVGACERGLEQARELGLTEVPCSLAGWRAARDAGLDEESLAWAVRVLLVEALPELAADDDEAVRMAVAEHPTCPPELLRVLAVDSAWLVRMTVAYHPACPADVIADLAEDEDVDVQRVIAERDDCPAEVLRILARDSSWRVRAAAAQHPACPPDALAVLLVDECPWVRRLTVVGGEA